MEAVCFYLAAAAYHQRQGKSSAQVSEIHGHLITTIQTLQGKSGHEEQDAA
jgi:hypothetical protein